MVHNCTSLTVDDKYVTREGLGMAVGRCMGVFNADEGITRSREPEWIQGKIHFLIRIFIRVRLMDNITKYKTMTCQPGAICTGMSEDVLIMRSKGEGATYRESLWRRIPLTDWFMELIYGSMKDHQRRLHGTDLYIDWDWLPVIRKEHRMLVYEVSFPINMKSLQCPFTGYPRKFRSRSGLQNHFSRLNWGYSILILEEHPKPLPHCERCEWKVTPWLLNNHH